MSEDEERGGTVIELLLREPEIVAWLEPARERRGRRAAARGVSTLDICGDEPWDGVAENDLTRRSPTRIVRRPCCAGT